MRFNYIQFERKDSLLVRIQDIGIGGSHMYLTEVERPNGGPSNIMSQNSTDFIKEHNESVHNEENIIHKSLALYQLKNPKGFDFSYMHCWLIIREVPRWVEF